MLFAYVLGDWVTLAACFVGWLLTISHYDPDRTGRDLTPADVVVLFFGSAAIWLFMSWAISKYWVHWVSSPN